ncbi:hypothetical protein R3P38DRAFT_3202187 [Favolaschia claudopus]|uniref:Uncharacterized protein n=1 Tax=Favolaschia claudopus TaxID=2862362 RepID=A0AAW0AUL6_9AGAR
MKTHQDLAAPAQCAEAALPRDDDEEDDPLARAKYTIDPVGDWGDKSDSGDSDSASDAGSETDSESSSESSSDSEADTDAERDVRGTKLKELKRSKAASRKERSKAAEKARTAKAGTAGKAGKATKAVTKTKTTSKASREGGKDKAKDKGKKKEDSAKRGDEGGRGKKRGGEETTEERAKKKTRGEGAGNAERSHVAKPKAAGGAGSAGNAEGGHVAKPKATGGGGSAGNAEGSHVAKPRAAGGGGSAARPDGAGGKEVEGPVRDRGGEAEPPNDPPEPTDPPQSDHPLPPACPAAAPEYFAQVYGEVSTEGLGNTFDALLESLSKLEEGYNWKNWERGGVAKGLRTMNRPSQVHAWIQAGRGARGVMSGGAGPTLSDTRAFGEAWWAWWRGMQPMWRKPNEASTGFARDAYPGGGEEEWKTLRFPGPNGALSLVASLFWWGRRIKSKGLSGADLEKWEEAVVDVTWMLGGLREAETKGGLPGPGEETDVPVPRISEEDIKVEEPARILHNAKISKLEKANASAYCKLGKMNRETIDARAYIKARDRAGDKLRDYTRELWDYQDKYGKWVPDADNAAWFQRKGIREEALLALRKLAVTTQTQSDFIKYFAKADAFREDFGHNFYHDDGLDDYLKQVEHRLHCARSLDEMFAGDSTKMAEYACQPVVLECFMPFSYPMYGLEDAFKAKARELVCELYGRPIEPSPRSDKVSTFRLTNRHAQDPDRRLQEYYRLQYVSSEVQAWNTSHLSCERDDLEEYRDFPWEEPRPLW